MTGREIVFDIIMLLTKFGYGNDSRLSEDYMFYKVNDYRAKEIRDTYNRNGFVEPIWLQDMGIMKCTPVNPAEDLTFQGLCKCGNISKFTIPPVVSFGNRDGLDEGVYRVASVCNTKKYFPISPEKLNEIPKGHIREKFHHFMRISNGLYLTHNPDEARVVLVLENPLDGYILETEYIESGSLIVGESYMAYENQVEHNNKGYKVGSTFTAVNSDFSGKGKVKLATQKRAWTMDDNYPMSKTMMEVVTLKILTQEFKIEQSQLADVTQDSRDQNQLIGNESSQKTS